MDFSHCVSQLRECDEDYQPADYSQFQMLQGIAKLEGRRNKHDNHCETEKEKRNLSGHAKLPSCRFLIAVLSFFSGLSFNVQGTRSEERNTERKRTEQRQETEKCQCKSEQASRNCGARAV